MRCKSQSSSQRKHESVVNVKEREDVDAASSIQQDAGERSCMCLRTSQPASEGQRIIQKRSVGYLSSEVRRGGRHDVTQVFRDGINPMSVCRDRV